MGRNDKDKFDSGMTWKPTCEDRTKSRKVLGLDHMTLSGRDLIHFSTTRKEGINRRKVGIIWDVVTILDNFVRMMEMVDIRTWNMVVDHPERIFCPAEEVSFLRFCL